MNNFGIVICLRNSKNLNTIKNRVDKLFSDVYIQIEDKHPISSTIGCFKAHIKALQHAINKLQNDNTKEYIFIGEEDMIINYDSYYYKNILKCLRDYNKNSNYILHLGGFPGISDELEDLYDSFNNKYCLTTKVFLTTCYVVNLKCAKKLINKLLKSSHKIHCDAIFSYSGIKQKLVIGNIVNQIQHKSDNSIMHNYISTRLITNIFLIANNFSIFISDNDIICLVIMLYSLLFHEKLYLCYIENLILLNKYFKYKLTEYNVGKYFNKNIYTFLEFIRFLRFYGFYIAFKDLS